MLLRGRRCIQKESQYTLILFVIGILYAGHQVAFAGLLHEEIAHVLVRFSFRFRREEDDKKSPQKAHCSKHEISTGRIDGFVDVDEEFSHQKGTKPIKSENDSNSTFNMVTLKHSYKVINEDPLSLASCGNISALTAHGRGPKPIEKAAMYTIKLIKGSVPMSLTVCGSMLESFLHDSLTSTLSTKRISQV